MRTLNEIIEATRNNEQTDYDELRNKMLTEIDVIKRSLRRHLEDLHILFMSDESGVDAEYYNAINLTLLKALEDIDKATNTRDTRLSKLKVRNSDS